MPLPFRTRREVNRYFGGRTIQCLICGKRFGRLSFHLAAKHAMTTDAYKSHFGLPWTRGLTSAHSHANSGWTKSRKSKAKKRARETQFFKYAHAAARREVAEYLKVEARKRLGPHAAGFGKQFDSRVRALFSKGLTDRAIAKALDVARMTVNRRTKRWRKRVNKRKGSLWHTLARSPSRRPSGGSG
jgi:ROS/MUCR transcriptional regulator protein/Homeodomain-like domain